MDGDTLGSNGASAQRGRELSLSFNIMYASNCLSRYLASWAKSTLFIPFSLALIIEILQCHRERTMLKYCRHGRLIEYPNQTSSQKLGVLTRLNLDVLHKHRKPMNGRIHR